ESYLAPAHIMDHCHIDAWLWPECLVGCELGLGWQMVRSAAEFRDGCLCASRRSRLHCCFPERWSSGLEFGLAPCLVWRGVGPGRCAGPPLVALRTQQPRRTGTANRWCSGGRESSADGSYAMASPAEPSFLDLCSFELGVWARLLGNCT